MEKLIAERYPVYAHADITVASRDVAHEVIVEEIIEARRDVPEMRCHRLNGLAALNRSVPRLTNLKC